MVDKIADERDNTIVEDDTNLNTERGKDPTEEKNKKHSKKEDNDRDLEIISPASYVAWTSN